MSRSQINSKRLKTSTLLLFFVAFLLALASGQALPRLADAQASALKDLSTQDQDDDVLRVNTDLVVLNATVLDKDGKFVPGLKRTDFQVFEDGTEQKLASFTAEETPFAAAILLDT